MARTDRSAEGLNYLLVAAISPTLIILMVGSLVFFLTHMAYDGEFPTRLRLSCGLFVIAAVLIARISIDEGREYASLFALALSVATLLSMLRYTDAGLVFVLPVVAFIWWSTDKLTWDCTVVDDQKDASGQGLLETVGMATDEPENMDTEATTQPSAVNEQSFWQRWLARRRRYHTPGVWVIYFGLAAVPLFGLGQVLLPAFARGQGFALLCVYVASALGLLMTTSFLQLRRYLLQRRLSLPDSTANTWLLTGTVMIAALMFLCLLFPRPNSGFSVLDSVSKVGSRADLRSSRWGFGNEGVQDEDQEGAGKASSEADRSDSPTGDLNSDEGQPGSGQATDARSTDGNESTSRTGSSEQASNESSRNTSDNADSQAENSSSPGEESSGENGQRSQQSKDDPSRDDASNAEQRPAEGGTPSSAKESSSSQSGQPPNGVKPPSGSPPIDFSVGSLARWIYLAIMAIIICYVLIRYGREIALAIVAFCRDFAEFWRRLFGGKPRTRPADDEPAVESQPTIRPFASFEDPFLGGLAAQLSTQQLVSYTFEAMQAWAAERDCARADDQTPLEFSSQLAKSNRQFGGLARNVAILYNQAAYAPGSLSGEATEHVRRMWQAMRS